MVNLMTSSLSILTWLKNHKRLAIELFLALLTAFSIYYGTTIHNKNVKLSERLEMANNNIEAYQELVNDSRQASIVLLADMESLKNSKDSVLHKLDSIRNVYNIKPKNTTLAATQTQTVLVTNGKGVKGDLIEILKDTVYTDTLQYNDLTKVYYSIGRDSVDMTIDLKNTQYIFTYTTKEYKNKKNFFKRLFTWDWKKVTKHKFVIHNTNDLLKEEDVRIVELE